MIFISRFSLKLTQQSSHMVFLLDVLVHELSVKVTPEAVVDEGLFFLVVGLGPGTVFEDDVVVPASLQPQVRLLRCWSVFVLKIKKKDL